MDENLFQEVLRAQKNRVYSYARYFLRHPEDAEDVTQEVFLRVWRSCPESDGERIAAWMTRVTHNLCIDLARRRRTAESRVAAAAGSATASTAGPPRPPGRALAGIAAVRAMTPSGGGAHPHDMALAGSARAVAPLAGGTPATTEPAGSQAMPGSPETTGLVSSHSGATWSSDPLAQVILGEEQRALLAALQALPGRARSILLLHYYQGMTHEAIAGQLGIPLNTVKVAAHRGRKVLRRLLTGPAPGSREEQGQAAGGRRRAAARRVR